MLLGEAHVLTEHNEYRARFYTFLCITHVLAKYNLFNIVHHTFIHIHLVIRFSHNYKCPQGVKVSVNRMVTSTYLQYTNCVL